WGKLTDSEPSRFIEEISPEFLEYLSAPETNYRYKPMIDADIFGDVDKSKLRQSKPLAGTPPKWITDNAPKPDANIRRLKPLAAQSQPTVSAGEAQGLNPGQWVMHERFGKGQVLSLEGAGADRKAEIKFEVGGIKKLLLKFARLEILP